MTVTANQTGTAESVQASSGAITGTIASTGYDQIVLQNGRTYTLAPTLRIGRRGQPVIAAALQPGDVVTRHVDPQTGWIDRIAVRRAASPGAITSVTVSPAGQELLVGDVMTVAAASPAHSAATFAITGLRTGLPMTESTNQPGRYIGTYAIQPGDYVANGTVVVTLTAPGGQLLTATAPVSVWINTSAIIPPAVGGAPVITGPMPGSGIATPFAVTGTAPPGALAKVTANYAGTVLLVNIRGTLGSQAVIADANGNWSTTFSQAPPVRGVSVTISAVLVDYTGRARSPTMMVNTTLN